MPSRTPPWLTASLLIGGQGLATFSEYALLFGLTLHILKVTNTALHVGLVQVSTMIPYLLGLLWGVVVDRMSRKRIIALVNVGRMALTLCIPFVLSGNFYFTYLILFLTAGATSLFNSARLSFLPDAIASNQLPAVNSLDQTVEPLAMAGGQVMAGLIINQFSITQLTLVCAAGYGLAALCYSLITPIVAQKPIAAPTGEGSSLRRVLRSVAAGWSFILKKPGLFYYGPGAIAAYLGVGIASALLTVFTIKELHMSEVQTSWLQSANVLGATIAGSVMVAYAKRFNRGLMVAFGYAGVGALFMMASQQTSFTNIFIFLTLGGLFNVFSLIGGRLLVQENTPPDMRGRVFSTKFALTRAFSPLGALLGSLAVDAHVASASTALLIAGALFVLTGLVGMFLPGVRRDGAVALHEGASA